MVWVDCDKIFPKLRSLDFKGWIKRMHLFAEKSMEDNKTLEGTVWEGYVILSEDYQNRSKKNEN